VALGCHDLLYLIHEVDGERLLAGEREQMTAKSEVVIAPKA
jgi:hypothetical protein